MRLVCGDCSQGAPGTMHPEREHCDGCGQWCFVYRMSEYHWRKLAMNQSEAQAFQDLSGKVDQLIAKVEELKAAQQPATPDNTADIAAVAAKAEAELTK